MTKGDTKLTLKTIEDPKTLILNRLVWSRIESEKCLGDVNSEFCLAISTADIDTC